MQQSRLLLRCVQCTQVDKKFEYKKFRNVYQRKETEKQMMHVKSTFTTVFMKQFNEIKMLLFTNDVH